MNRARKKSRSIANVAELNGDQNTSTNQDTSASSTTIAAYTPSTETAASQFAGKSPSDILLPSMSDIEKLQKLKEWILSDQHPMFTSAPKVAYLLSLRVPAPSWSAADSNGSSNSLGGDQERQSGAVPLAERLSSPKMQPYTGDDQPFNDAYGNEDQHGQNDHQSTPFQDNQNTSGPYEGTHGPPGSDSFNDVEMADSRTQGSTGPVLTPTHTAHPYPRHYSRPSDDQRRYEQGEDGRRSPRNDTRQWQERRGPANGNYSRHPAGDGGRYPPGNYRGGYQNHGDRRYSGSDYQQHPNHRNYEYDRNADRRPDYQSDDRHGGRQQGYGSRGGYYQSYGPRQTYERKGDYNRPSGREPSLPLKTDDLDGAKPTEENTSPMEVQDATENKMMTDDQSAPEKSGNSANVTSPPSPSSANGGPPQSVGESATLPGLGSPPRSEAQLESVPGASAQDEKASGTASPSSPLEGDDAGRDPQYRDQDGNYKSNPGNYTGRNQDYRRQPQDTRPRADSYQRYPPHERSYERLPTRDDRTYPPRDTSYRPNYAPPPADGRRFVPRDAGYADEAYYRGRDYRPPADWDTKRRESERVPDTRLYERDRELRPGPPAAHGPPRHVSTRPYPPAVDRDSVPPRQAPPRMPAEAYPVPSRYDPEPYPLPHSAPPPPGSYSRIRTRSMSPVRRDYQPEDRPPPKRVRGPDEPYVASVPRPPQYGGQYPPPPQRRPQDYPDRRPTGGAQAAYYRPDDRGPPRY